VDIHFPQNGSLKDKRQHLRSLKAGLARKLGASVAEVGYHDLWQRTRVIFSICSNSLQDSDHAMDEAVRYLESRDYLLSALHREIIKVEGEQ
jgi:uncharacterized protein YlxP (DUF503 family)